MTELEDGAVSLLKATAEIIGKGWTQGCKARDRAGEPVDHDDPAARRWSLNGALSLATRDLYGVGHIAYRCLLAETGCLTLRDYNDHACYRKSDVIAPIHRAIETLERSL